MSSTKKRLIVVVVLAALLPAVGLAPSHGDAGSTRRIPVTVTVVEARDFEERISTQGALAPKNYAMVSPLVDGVVTNMFIEEGDWVTANETALFQIDKVALTQAYEVALKDRTIAEYARIDAEAQVVAAEAQYEKAKLDYERFVRLRAQQAITPDAMEQMEAGYTVAGSQLQRARTAVNLRAEQESQAAAALIIAQKRLDDSRVVSPVDGWVSSRTIEAGEFARAGTAVIRVVDTRVLEASAFFPGEYYPRFVVGETRLRIRVGDTELGRLPVSYKSPEISDQLRTFEVKCLIENPPEGVASGAIAQVEAVLAARTGPAVPHDVIQIRDGREIVFVVDEDTARAVEVEKGLSTDGWTEILNDMVPPGTRVISRGYNLVNDGTPVVVQREES